MSEIGVNQPKTYSRKLGRNYAYRGVVSSLLNIDTLLDSAPIELKAKKHRPKHNKNVLVYLLSLIYYGLVDEYSDLEPVIDDRYSRLCYEYLRPIYHNYKEYLDYLVKCSVIESNASWQNKRRCKGYRYTETYRHGLRNPTVIFIQDEKLFKKLQAVRQPRKVKRQYPELYGFLRGLHFDMDRVDDILNTVYPNQSDEHKKKLQYHLIENCNDPDRWTFRTGRTGRLYTPITNLKKELRDCMLYKGEQLYEIDIKSSIPIMSLTLFDKESFNYSLFKEYSKHKSSIKDTIHTLYYFSFLPFEVSCIMSSKNRQVDISDIDRYRNDVLSEDIYIKLRDAWNNLLNRTYTRNTAKKKFLTILNSPKHWGSKEKDILNEIYPNVMYIIDAMNGYFKTKNRRSEGTYVYNGDKPAFAYYTQSIESELVLDRICYRLTKEYPHVPLFTVHDAIYTTAEYLDLLTGIIDIESLQFLGVSPTVRIMHPSFT